MSQEQQHKHAIPGLLRININIMYIKKTPELDMRQSFNIAIMRQRDNVLRLR